MKRLVWLGVLFVPLAMLGIIFFLLLTSTDDPSEEVLQASPTSPPLQIQVGNTSTPLPTPTPSPAFVPPTASPIPTLVTDNLPVAVRVSPIPVEATATSAIPFTSNQPATLPAADWAGSGVTVNTAEGSPPIVTGGCVLTTLDAETYVNVRDYPSLSAGVQNTLHPNQQYKVIAVSTEADGTWYSLERGWVGGGVVNVYGDGCYTLPNASRVVWRSFGHVDFANLKKYRTVTNIRVEQYMLNYPMLIFENGTIWYNPNGWQR